MPGILAVVLLTVDPFSFPLPANGTYLNSACSCAEKNIGNKNADCYVYNFVFMDLPS